MHTTDIIIIICSLLDINECNGLHDCLTGATCTNGEGSYACECPSGFGGDGRWPRYGQGCIGILHVYEHVMQQCILYTVAITQPVTIQMSLLHDIVHAPMATCISYAYM